MNVILTYGIRLLIACLVMAGPYLMIRRPWIRDNPCREGLMAFFWIFHLGLCILVLEGNWQTPSAMLEDAVYRWQNGIEVSLTPGASTLCLYREYAKSFFLMNIVGNTVLFMPLGLGLPLLWKRWQKFPRVLLTGFCYTLCIETIQLFIGRYSDVDDLILNTLGTVLGYLIYKLLKKRMPGLDQLAL